MKEATYITILGWMRYLNLSLVERTVYAIIYGFSQDGDSTFHGSRQYLADWCGCTTKTIDAALRTLVERDLITKREKFVSGIKFCEYSANFPTGEKISLPGKNTEIGGEKISDPKEKISHNNIVNNEELYSSSNSNNRGNASRFTPPTIEEVEAYCIERRNRINPQHFIDFYSANGWMVGKNKMKDWRAAVRTWETREKEKRNGSKSNDPGNPANYRQSGGPGSRYPEDTI